jgi:vacuolar protein-sorting-associated protein 4
MDVSQKLQVTKDKTD